MSAFRTPPGPPHTRVSSLTRKSDSPDDVGTGGRLSLVLPDLRPLVNDGSLSYFRDHGLSPVNRGRTVDPDFPCPKGIIRVTGHEEGTGPYQ